MQTQRVSGTTGLVGLLGFPVAHSISPLLHNHLMRHYGLDMAYVPLPVAPRDLHGAIRAIRTCGFVGANVTIPHKRQTMHYCDSVSELSRRVGAVNTLVCRNGGLHGDTTDAAGFYRALAWMNHNPRGGACLLLGTGGAARSLAFSMAIDGIPRTLTIAGRNLGKARALADEIARECGRDVHAVGLDDPAMAEICAPQRCVSTVRASGCTPMSTKRRSIGATCTPAWPFLTRSTTRPAHA